MRGYEYDKTTRVRQSDLLRQFQSVHIAAQVDIQKINTCVMAGSDLFQQYIRVFGIQNKLHIQFLYQHRILNDLYDSLPLYGIVFTYKDI